MSKALRENLQRAFLGMQRNGILVRKNCAITMSDAADEMAHAIEGLPVAVAGRHARRRALL